VSLLLFAACGGGTNGWAGVELLPPPGVVPPARPSNKCGVCVMWVATRRVQTACGSVDVGRLVPDGDPMLDGAPDGAFVRVVDDTPAPVVEEATAEPGKVRRTSRRAQ
jgi:hypothetical protein